MSPQRLQLSRKKGYRKPEGAVVVSRPSKWGNPFRVGDPCQEMNWLTGEWESWTVQDRAHAVRLFREALTPGSTFYADVQRELRGKDLACWCPLDSACHGNELLRIANL